MNYYRVIFLLFLTRILDGVTTYIATPELKYEMNFLVSFFNFEWYSFIFSGICFLILTVIWYSYSVKEYNILDCKSDKLKNYIGLTFFGIMNFKWSYLLYKIPKLKVTFVFFGLVFVKALIIYSLFLIVNNLIVFFSFELDFLKPFYKNIYYPIQLYLIYFLPILIVVYFSVNLIKKSHIFFNK